MKEEYRILRFISVAFKVLAFIGFVGIFFITIINITTTRGMGDANLGYAIFNNLFPIFFGVFQALFLYSFGELILLFIGIREDLGEIKES